MAKVVVLGGGIAGFSAAHELAERGFEVVLIEKTGIPGGKARSSPVYRWGRSPGRPSRATRVANPGDPVTWVPGEHGFRFFPGFYRHVVDSMTRIPTPGGITAADHLVPISRCGLTQYDKPTFNFPMRFPRTPATSARRSAAVLAGFSSVTELTPAELWRTSAARSLADPDVVRGAAPRGVRADPVVGVHRRGVPLGRHYQKFLAAGITRSLVAAHAETASTRTIGTIFVQLLLDVVDPLVATSDRVLDGPTNQVWLYPWLQYLRTLDVTTCRRRRSPRSFTADGRISGVRVESAGGTETHPG